MVVDRGSLVGLLMLEDCDGVLGGWGVSVVLDIVESWVVGEV